MGFRLFFILMSLLFVEISCSAAKQDGKTPRQNDDADGVAGGAGNLPQAPDAGLPPATGPAPATPASPVTPMNPIATAPGEPSGPAPGRPAPLPAPDPGIPQVDPQTPAPSAPAQPATGTCADLKSGDGFIDADGLYAVLGKMVDVGPRHTASPADIAWLDYLQGRMEEIGMSSIARDKVTVTGHGIMSHPSAPKSGTTYHVSGLLPGNGKNGDKVIVMGVHSDGQNSIEENGTVILMEIAAWLARIPKECRNYTYALVFATAHMASADSKEAAGWAVKHPDIMRRAVAFVSPEHVGFLRRDKKTPISFAMMATSSALQSLAKKLIAEEGVKNITISTAGIGTGGVWRIISGKPTVGGMTSQVDAFLAGLFDPEVGMDQVDKGIFHRTSRMFARLVGEMDGMSADEMKR